MVFQEALRCYKAGSPAGAAFMLGAASEKAILLLIENYGSRIKDEKHKESFFSRVNNKMISQKYDEFKKIIQVGKPQTNINYHSRKILNNCLMEPLISIGILATQLVIRK